MHWNKKILFVLAVSLVLFVAAFPAWAEDISLFYFMELEQMPPLVEGPYSPYPEGGEEAEHATAEGSFDTVGDLGSAKAVNEGDIIGNTLHEAQTDRRTQMIDSGNDNVGVISINQASGNMNNQSNQRVFVFPAQPTAVGLVQFDSAVEVSGNVLHSTGVTKQDQIVNSFHNNTGVIGINQAAGSLNSQRNTLVMAIGGTWTLTDMELGDVRCDNTMVEEEASGRLDSISGSFTHTHGIVQVTQSAGDLNILSNNVALSFREINLQ